MRDWKDTFNVPAQLLTTWQSKIGHTNGSHCSGKDLRVDSCCASANSDIFYSGLRRHTTRIWSFWQPLRGTITQFPQNIKRRWDCFSLSHYFLQLQCWSRQEYWSLGHHIFSYSPIRSATVSCWLLLVLSHTNIQSKIFFWLFSFIHTEEGQADRLQPKFILQIFSTILIYKILCHKYLCLYRSINYKSVIYGYHR